MTTSMFGIKALCVTELYKDYEVNISTGEISECNKTYSFPRTMLNLFHWIRSSRKQFESSPDTGLLSKTLSRIPHVIWNYLIKLIFLGALVIIFYPTAIFINTFICFFLLICSPISIVLWIIVSYIFSILFYNRYDRFKFFPLFRIILLDFFLGVIIQLIVWVASIILHPVLSFLVFLYSQIHFLLRYIYDCLTYYIIKCCGKVPMTDSCVAWKISGPGLFRERYFDIRNNDILSLVIAELEQRIMRHYKCQMEAIIEAPKESINYLNKMFSVLGFGKLSNRELANSVNFYIYKLNEQIKERDVYPILSPNMRIKFTKTRIDDVKNLVEQYIVQYSEQNDISFEIDNYGDNKIQKLAEEILKKIFGELIFEPLEDTDKIVKLQPFFKHDLDLITVKLFENPDFEDKKLIEERPVNEEKNIELPEVARFRDIFKLNNHLFLNINVLSKDEKNEFFDENNVVIFKK